MELPSIERIAECLCNVALHDDVMCKIMKLSEIHYMKLYKEGWYVLNNELHRYLKRILKFPNEKMFLGFKGNLKGGNIQSKI